MSKGQKYGWTDVKGSHQRESIIYIGCMKGYISKAHQRGSTKGQINMESLKCTSMKIHKRAGQWGCTKGYINEWPKKGSTGQEYGLMSKRVKTFDKSRSYHSANDDPHPSLRDVKRSQKYELHITLPPMTTLPHLSGSSFGLNWDHLLFAFHRDFPAENENVLLHQIVNIETQLWI